MEVLKRGRVISSWGVVFVGLVKEWLTQKEVLQFCREGKILSDADRLMTLEVAVSESRFVFLETIRRFSIEDGEPHIVWNEDSQLQEYGGIPNQFLEFWSIEQLIKIASSEKIEEEKLYGAHVIHSDFGYPEEWLHFLPIAPPEYHEAKGHARYERFLQYLDDKINMGIWGTERADTNKSWSENLT